MLKTFKSMPLWVKIIILPLAIGAMGSGAALVHVIKHHPETVYPTMETDPVPSSSDAADDIAIWPNPDNPAGSLIIGTDKDGGIAVYNMSGDQLSYRPDGRMNNVDLRSGVNLGGRDITLVVATERKEKQLICYELDPAGKLILLSKIDVGPTVYGCCLYRSKKTGMLFAILTDDTEKGHVQQWRLYPNEAGDAFVGKLERGWDMGAMAEGCVGDDFNGHVYIAVEDRGIAMFDGELGEPIPGHHHVDTASPIGPLKPDVEGLALVREGDEGLGLLIASSQGNDRFVVYSRGGSHRKIGSFVIKSADGIDEVTGTDGIEVTTASLGPGFEHGALVVQDDKNDDGNQNFKAVPLERVIQALGLQK